LFLKRGFKMRIYFAGNKKVYAEFNGFTVQTDQPVEGGGDGTAPAPYDLFLASLGTCAGIYVKGFCDSRGLSPMVSKSFKISNMILSIVKLAKSRSIYECLRASRINICQP
jgi:organic hydroperoxide reductase OsmC/OhrA